MTSAMSEEFDAYNTALQLPEETIRTAQEAVARNEPLKEYLRVSGAGNSPEVIRAFACNPDGDPSENLGPVHGKRFSEKRRAASIPKPNPAPSISKDFSFGDFMMGKHL